MKYIGIILTGTSGSGKTTIANKFVSDFTDFKIVNSVTTRNKRDEDSNYTFLDKKEFYILKSDNKLLIDAEYRGEYYGIAKEDFANVLENNKIPILILTPNTANSLNNNFFKYNENFLILFIDTTDEQLKNRQTIRHEIIDHDLFGQREKDRNIIKDISQNQESLFYIIRNEDSTLLNNIINLIYSLWEFRNLGGVLSKKIITLMLKCGLLLENSDLNKISGASYDLSLGDQYWQDGKVKTLNAKNPFIDLKPGDYVIVSSEEVAKFPKDIAGRFDLTVSLFCQGIILSNGPQIDPGFEGRLFCLLFNTSNNSISLKHKAHYATLEFYKLLEPTVSYKEKYLGKKDIIDYLPKPSAPSVIVGMQKDIKSLKSAKWWEKTLPLIISIFAIVAAIVGPIIISLIRDP